MDKAEGKNIEKFYADLRQEVRRCFYELMDAHPEDIELEQLYDLTGKSLSVCAAAAQFTGTLLDSHEAGAQHSPQAHEFEALNKHGGALFQLAYVRDWLQRHNVPGDTEVTEALEEVWKKLVARRAHVSEQVHYFSLPLGSKESYVEWLEKDVMRRQDQAHRPR